MDQNLTDFAAQWLRVLGFAPQRMADAPGLVVARTLAMLINEAADAVLQGVCSEAGADAAMKLGVNYPQGPFEFLSHWSVGEVVQLLDALDQCIPEPKRAIDRPFLMPIEGVHTIEQLLASTPHPPDLAVKNLADTAAVSAWIFS